MSIRARLAAAVFALVVTSGVTINTIPAFAQQPPAAPAATAGPVFEIRTYIASAGKFEDLQKRFREHTIRIFARHGMKSIGYWVPTDQRNTLVYIIQHESREAAARNWKAFLSDPEWVKVAEASNVGGNIVSLHERVIARRAGRFVLRHRGRLLPDQVRNCGRSDWFIPRRQRFRIIARSVFPRT